MLYAVLTVKCVCSGKRVCKNGFMLPSVLFISEIYIKCAYCTRLIMFPLIARLAFSVWNLSLQCIFLYHLQY